MSDRTSWEPDTGRMGNWRAMFEQPRSDRPAPLAGDAAGSPFDDAPDDAGMDSNSAAYRPWILQRGRTRPAMMLGLRQFDPRSGLWRGWSLSYPSLHAIEYLGDRMACLDFGTRKFMIEGVGLTDMVEHLQQGSVLMLQEYASAAWPVRPEGPLITAIRQLGKEERRDG